ncbi:hypothetical protein OF377_02310 [Ureaplasma sp. ES3154-GEN]|uniref:hypothetical protein n=1 Tax=Ureaplasma sp. ES3154-GEN TaxID=2984844 RepID=UPI0021E882CE|nr:hypothetical protein [Ureaplasma sp. ES3154-GEN]MCV3743697.1 hypothetical protein [Ureaplasma sp. ES3154-GEN]
MKIFNYLNWKVFTDGKQQTQIDNNGKWMYFFKIGIDDEFVDKICERVIKENIVKNCKRTLYDSNPNQRGVVCFFLPYDINGSLEHHKKLLKFMIENNLIPKTKTKKLYDISFKLDSQTNAKQYTTTKIYGNNLVTQENVQKFEPVLKLSNFVKLETGEFF